MEETLTFTASKLQAVSQAVLQAAGTPEDIATYVARMVAESHLMGHDSHGVLRVLEYVDYIESGRYNPAARPAILRETPTTAVVKGNWGFGHFSARFATEVAIRKAKEMNIAAVSIIECHHIGRLGEFSMMIAREGMIGMVVTGGFSPPFAGVAPYGGTRPALGTNPWSFAVPAGVREPFMSDFATSIVAEGKLQVARAKGEKVPEGWIKDSEGRPTTDPSEFFKGGMMVPFGGHKGYALCLMADLLGGFLAGAEILKPPPDTQGTFIMALNIDAFRPLDEYVKAVDKRLTAIKSIPPEPGFEEVLIPGEIEARSRERRLREGIPIPEDTWDKIASIASRLNLDVDKITGA